MDVDEAGPSPGTEQQGKATFRPVVAASVAGGFRLATHFAHHDDERRLQADRLASRSFNNASPIRSRLGKFELIEHPDFFRFSRSLA